MNEELTALITEALRSVLAADDIGTGTMMGADFAVAFQDAARRCEAALEILEAARQKHASQGETK